MRLTVLGSPQCRKLQSQISKTAHVNLQVKVEERRRREPNHGRQIGGNIRLERDNPAEADADYVAENRVSFK
jgi:hypothetical protein